MSLEVIIKNTGDDMVSLVAGSPRVRVLDALRRHVDGPGWYAAVGRHDVRLPPSAEQAMQCSVELRGPRGGAARAPLPVGTYFLECSVIVARDDGPLGDGWTLTTPQQAFEVVVLTLADGTDVAP